MSYGPEIIHATNRTIDQLAALARLIDPEYADACEDTILSNRAPRTDRERLVSALEALAYDLNGSGLADRDTIGDAIRYQDYGRDHRAGIGG